MAISLFINLLKCNFKIRKLVIEKLHRPLDNYIHDEIANETGIIIIEWS